MASGSSTQQRLLDSTLICLSRHGVAKTTVDDVAREAGVGRATLYRYFPNKQALINATFDSEVVRISAAIDNSGAEQIDLEEAVVAMMSVAANEVANHDALQFALSNEPDQVLPYLAFEGGEHFILLAARAFLPSLSRFLPAEMVVRSSEWCARIVLAFLVPSARLVIADEVVVRDAVRNFVLPGIVPESLRTSNAGI
ncbi:MAG: TetR/AcrR family transcriptional regulator [Actinomycetes bacterium]